MVIVSFELSCWNKKELFVYYCGYTVGFPGEAVVQESTCQCRRCKRRGFHSWVRKIPWRRKWQPTPVFLPGKSHGQRSLMGYSPRGPKESDTTELLSTRAHTHIYCTSIIEYVLLFSKICSFPWESWHHFDHLLFILPLWRNTKREACHVPYHLGCQIAVPFFFLEVEETFSTFLFCCI